MKAIKRTPPTQSDLMEMLQEHVSFEINRFRLAVSMWERQTDDHLVDAMIRESCLIHMRLLLDFFYPRPNSKTGKFKDVFASDYLPDEEQLSEPLRELLAFPPWLQDYRNQLDWRLAHMTTERLTFRKQRRAWKAEKQFMHLENLLSEFLAALPEETRTRFDPHQQ